MIKLFLSLGTICLSLNTAQAGQVRCFESIDAQSIAGSGAFDLLIDNVPASFARNEYIDMKVENAHIHVNRALTTLDRDLDGLATGGLGTESGKLLIVVRESTLGWLIQIRAEPWNNLGVTNGKVEQGSPGAQLLPVTCVYNRSF